MNWWWVGAGLLVLVGGLLGWRDTKHPDRADYESQPYD